MARGFGALAGAVLLAMCVVACTGPDRELPAVSETEGSLSPTPQGPGPSGLEPESANISSTPLPTAPTGLPADAATSVLRIGPRTAIPSLSSAAEPGADAAEATTGATVPAQGSAPTAEGALAVYSGSGIFGTPPALAATPFHELAGSDALSGTMVAPSPTPVETISPQATPLPANTLAPVPTPTVTPTPRPTSTPLPTPTPVPESLVAVELDVEGAPAGAGQEVAVRVRINAGEKNPVDAAQVYLDFDRSKLEIISLKPGGKLRFVLQNETSNLAGRIGFAAGTTGAGATSPFTLCTIVFQVLASAGPGETTINFASPRFPRHTKIVHRGFNVSGELRPATVALK